MQTIILSPRWARDLSPRVMDWLEARLTLQEETGPCWKLTDARRIAIYVGDEAINLHVAPGDIVDWTGDSPREVEQGFMARCPLAGLDEVTRHAIGEFAREHARQLEVLRGFDRALFAGVGESRLTEAGTVQAALLPEDLFAAVLDWEPGDEDCRGEACGEPIYIIIDPQGRIFLKHGDGDLVAPVLHAAGPEELSEIVNGLLAATSMQVPLGEGKERLTRLFRQGASSVP